MKTKYGIFFLILGLILVSCGDDELLVPKPPTFLRINMPEHAYAKMTQDVPYSYELSKSYFAKPVVYGTVVTPHQEINLGPLNGLVYLNYYPIPNRDSLSRYINLSNDKVDEHKIKATKIVDKQIIDPKRKVYGTFFELQGDVATNFQFYLTDSSSNFVRGEVLMNCRPNYDSLRPSLDYLRQDLMHLVETFEWKKK